MERSIERVGARPDIAKPSHDITLMQRKLARTSERRRILVVDDDVSTSELLASINDRETYEVVPARDGRAAFRLLMHDAAFNLAIFNMTMPNLQGVDILRHMKTEKRLMRIPVIVVGGDASSAIIADSFAAGAVAFLPKPFCKDQLQRILRLILGAQPVPVAILTAG